MMEGVREGMFIPAAWLWKCGDAAIIPGDGNHGHNLMMATASDTAASHHLHRQFLPGRLILLANFGHASPAFAKSTCV